MASDAVLGMLRKNETLRKNLGRVAQANYTYILLRANLLSTNLLSTNLLSTNLLSEDLLSEDLLSKDQ
jgi:hypothetical protein